MPAVKKVAIIGCGVGGLSAIKSCLDAGLEPTCFEQQSWFGGIWNYTNEARPNLGSVHNNTITNVSKALMCFSDFPVPKEWPNYMHHRQFMMYLEMYADEFGLKQYIKLNTKVEWLSKAKDHAENGKWLISYSRSTTSEEVANENQTSEEIFDVVMICTGHLSYPSVPNITGVEEFKGVKVHSGDYRTFHPYVGKRVVVVGCSYSAGDIATELSIHASKVYLSSRRGGFITKRLVPGTTIPFDHQMTRAENFVSNYFNRSLMGGLAFKEYDFVRLGLQPTGKLGVDQFPFISDHLLDMVFTGRVVVKGKLTQLRETSVVFDDEDVLEDIDAVVFATGFKLKFPFASDVINVEEEHYVRLYKYIFVPHEKHQTLAIIGAVETHGPHIPILEMQTRVAAEVLSGRCVLPSMEKRLAECVAKETLWTKIGRSKEKFLYDAHLVPYMDELGEMLGVKPNLWSISLKDPKLAFQCFFGPAVPAQYRLQGPNSWKEARNVVMRTHEDYLYPLKTKRCLQPITVEAKSYFYHVLSLGLVVIVAFIFRSLV